MSVNVISRRGRHQERPFPKFLETKWQLGVSKPAEAYMMGRRKAQLKLADVIRIVAQFSRNDLETSLAITDLLNRGVVRVHINGHDRRVVVR
jgi:hypothetical protein